MLSFKDDGPVPFNKVDKVNTQMRPKCGTEKKVDLARIRTWNLLIRSQTRYPLRHKALDVESGNAKVFIIGPPTTIQNETSTDSSYPLFIFN